MGIIFSIWIYGLISAWCLEEVFSQGDSKCLLQCNANADCMNNNGTYTCVCKSGYKGDGYFCKEINYCKKSPCINGKCRSTPKGSECLCEPGWEGVTCNRDVDECQAGLSRCHPKATCLNTYGSYSCACTAGYKGDGFTCLEINYCKTSPCINGHCRSHSRGFQCLCNPGWEGITCDQDVNECNSGLNMCHSEATCVNAAGSYKCYCNTGFRGDGFTCTEINLCKTSPCKNGHCRNDVNQFECICNPGWKGATCSEEMNECLSNPCSNGATCTDLVNSFSCSCLPGYTGVTCAADIDECASSPCKHRTCINTPGSYSCSCLPGWTGVNCETETQSTLLSTTSSAIGQMTSHIMNGSTTSIQINGITSSANLKVSKLGNVTNSTTAHIVQSTSQLSHTEARLAKSSQEIPGSSATNVDYYTSTVTFVPSVTPAIVSATGYSTNKSKPETTHLSTLYLKTSNANTRNGQHSSTLVTRILHDITSSEVTTLLSPITSIKGTNSGISKLGSSTNTLTFTLANVTSSEVPSESIKNSGEIATINRTTVFERQSTTRSKISTTETSDSKMASQNMLKYKGEGTDATAITPSIILRSSMFSSQESRLQQVTTESTVVSEVTSLKAESEVYTSTISPSWQNRISSSVSPINTVFLTSENNMGVNLSTISNISMNILKNGTLSENVTASSMFKTSSKVSDIVASEFTGLTSKSENITNTADSETLYHTNFEIPKMTSFGESTTYLSDTYRTQEKSSSTAQTSSSLQAMMTSSEQYTFSAFKGSLNTLSENLITTVMTDKTPTQGINRSYHSVVNTHANKVISVTSEETTASPQVVSEVSLASPADSTDISTVSSNKITFQTLKIIPQASRTGQSTEKGQNAALTSSTPPISTHEISITSVKPEASSILIDRRISANKVLIPKGTTSGSIISITETSTSTPSATLSPSDMDTTTTTSGNNIVSLPILDISVRSLNTSSQSVSESKVSERFSKASNLNLISTNENTETSSVIEATEPLYSWSNSNIHSTAQSHTLSNPVTKIPTNVASQPPETNAIQSDTTKSPIPGARASTDWNVASMRSTRVTQNNNVVALEFSKPTSNLKPETAENLQSHSTFRPLMFGKDNFPILHTEIMTSSFASLTDRYIQHSTSTNPNRISGVDTSTPLVSNKITVYALNARSAVTSNPHDNLKTSTIRKESNTESTATHFEEFRSSVPITRGAISTSSVFSMTSTLPNHFTYGNLESVTSATTRTNTNLTTASYENSNTLVTSATSYNTVNSSLPTQTRPKTLSSTVEDDHVLTTKSDIQSTNSGDHQTASPMYSTTNSSEISTNISFNSSSRTTQFTSSSSSLAEINTSSITRRSSSLPFQVITALSNSAQENTSSSNISYSLTSDFENQTTNGIKYTQLYFPRLMTESRSTTSKSEIISSAFTGNSSVSPIPSTYPEAQEVDTGTNLSDVTSKVAMMYVTNTAQNTSWVTSREMKATGHTALNMLATKHASNTLDTSHMTSNSHIIDTSQSQFAITVLNSTSSTGTYPDEETSSEETMSRSINGTYIRNVTSSTEASRNNPYSTNQEAQSVTQSGVQTSARLDVTYSGTKSENPKFTYSRETVSKIPYVTYSDITTHKILNNTESTEERQFQDFTSIIHTINTGETASSMDDMRHSKETSAVPVFTFSEKMLNKTLNVTHSMKIFSNADDTRSKVTQLQTTISRRHNITQFEKISSKSPDVSYHGEILHTSPNVTYLELVGTRPYTLYPDKKTSTRTDIAYSEVTRKNTVGTNSEERAKNKDSSTTDKEMTNTHGMTSRNGPHFSLSENTSQIPDFTHTENSAYKWTYNLSRKTSKKSHSSNSAETGKILDVTYPPKSVSKMPAVPYSEEMMTIRPSFIHSVKAISTATDIPDFEETIIKHTDVPKEKSSRPDVPLLKETTRHSQVTPRISGYITQSERGSNKTPQITNLGVSVNINPGSTYSAGTRRSPDLIYLEKTSEKPLTTQSEDTSRHLDLTKQDDKSTSKTDSTLLQETSKHIDSLQAKEIESRPANVTGKYIVTSREITGSKRSEDMHLEGITNAPSTRLDVTYSENTVSKMTDLAHSGGRTSKSLDRFFSVGTTFKRPNVVKETSAWTKHANITNFQKTTKMPNLTQFQITSEMHDDAHSEETSRNNEDVTTVLVSTKSEAKFLVQPTTNRTNSTFADETSNAEEGTYLAGTSRPVATYSGETITESTDVPNLSSRPNVTLLGDIRSMQHDTQLRDTSREQQAAQLQITRVKSKDGTQSGITSNKTSRLPNTDVSLSANPMTTFSAWTTGRRLNVTFSEETSARSENVKNAEISLSMKSDGIYSRDITSQVPDFTYSDNTMSKSQDVTYSEKRISSRQDNLSSEGTTLKGQDITGTEQASEMKDVTNLEEVSKIPKVIQLQESASVRKDATQPEGSTRNQATTSEIMSTFTGITLLSSEDITYSDKKSKSPEVTHSKETINYSEGARHARANSDKAHQSVHNTLIKYTPSEYSNIAISEASTRPGTTNIEKTTTKGLHTTQLGETTTRMPQITQLQTASKRQNVTQSESTSSKSPHFTDLIASKSTWQDIIHSKVTIRRVTEATAITTKSDETTSNGQEAEYLEEASTISGETSNIPLSERIYVTNSTVTISSYGIFSEERRKTQEDTHPKGITHNKPNVTQSEETINGPSNVSLSKTSTITLPNVMYSVGAINKRQNVTYTNQASSQPTVTHLTGNTRRNNETNLGLADSPAMTSNPLKFVTSHESHISIHFTTLIPRLFSKETQPSITDSVITSNKMSASSSVHTEKSTSTTSYVNKTTSLPTLASIEKDFTSSVDSSGSSTFKVVSDLHPSTAIHTAFQTSKPLHTLSVSPMKQSSLSNYISIPVYPSETSNVSYEILTTPQHSSTYNEISTKTWTEAHISVSTTAEDTVSTVSTHNTIYPNDNSSSYGIPPRSTTLNSAPVSSTSGRAVPLFAYGDSAGDITYVLRRIDFNSPLFQPVMGFPFGNQLRSFLYYTDNGQIIFPLSKSSIFSYPNPPANGFTADYNVATIAVFWDDADFSKNVGTTYYKEYIKCSSGNESFITEVEEMISRYMNTSYTAQWTLKITWDKVLAYPAKDDDSQTNTYQAVLTTDGFVSYILMLYKDGGMNWDVSNHLTEVVIGYSSGISNNFFKNDDIMRRPAYEKYRPSNYVGYNSDMTGLWLYTLNSNAVNNSRMKCLDWYATQPSASQWNASLLSCPCLYQQGCADFRYRTTKAVLAQSPAVRMLRPTFPSNFGAGIRCLYNLKNNFLEGFQERTWTFAPVVPDEEVLSQEWCCNEVDDPQFCEMYREKRPSVNCWDYTPLSSGWMFGDSHITTLDGLNYTFNGFGDFMLLNASDTGISVILQGRTIQTGTAMATNFQAFVVQYISNTTNVKVEWYLSKGVINTYINGHAVNFSYSADINAKINNSNPGVFLLNDGSITATFEGLLSVSVSAYAKILNAIVILPSQFLNKTMGLLGVWNWYMSDDLMRPDGSYISIKSREEDIFNYGKSWEVTQDSLFTINQSRPIPSNFTPVFFNELISTNMGKYLDVSSACANNKECIYDALSSGSETIGLQALKMFTDFQSLNITLNLMPPKIIGASNIRAFLMESVQKLYKAHGAGTTFTAYTSMHLNVTETGLVTWAPSSPHDFTFQLEAIDSYNVSSFFFIKFIVCSCRVSSECDYKQITRINSSSLYVANCNCIDNYTGIFCQQHINPCTQGCYNNVSCDPLKGCGPCPAGLSGDGLHCSDFDECSQTPCSPNAVCTNTLKGYNCTCKQGFTGNGTHCEDRNKCLTNPCSPNATCTNTKSGYLCSCNKGFLGDGLHCDDVNECLNNPCSSNAYCSNTLGSFVCSCNAGYTGNGYKCTISCGPCDPDYCGNGQPCRRDGSTCAQKCSCHPMFSDDRCLEAGNTYIPEAAENTPQRTLHLRMSSRVNLTAEEANHTVAEFMRWLPVNRFVNISHFRIYPYVNSMYHISLTSKFTYNGNISIITFLNEQLISAIRHLIYSGSPNMFRTAVIGNITFERVRDGQYYTVDQLEPYFTCSLYGYLLYTLNKESFTCESQCKTTCQNNATCVHMKDEIICRCNNFSIYSTSGTHCENLSMNLNAFFGILFGSLAFLFLLLLGIGLCVCYCHKRYYQEKDAESCINENIFQKKPSILSFKIRRPTIPDVIVAPEEPSLVRWSPYVDNELSGIYRIHSFPR